MIKVTGFNVRGITEDDNKQILKCINEENEMTIDQYGRIWNEGGIYIADGFLTDDGICC